MDDLPDLLHKRRDDLIAIFGADAIDEMRVLFTDENGPALRHQISHGTMTFGNFFSGGAVYAWWFLLRLFFLPVLLARTSDTATEPRTSAG